MSWPGRAAAGCLALLLTGGTPSMPAQADTRLTSLAARLPEGTRLAPVDWANLPGWAEDDHAEAFTTFLRTCPADLPALRAGLPRPPALQAACDEALARPKPISPNEARRFFETRFLPVEVAPAGGQGFLTGYYEPELPASRVATPDFPEPVLKRPADLVTVPQGQPAPAGLDPALQAYRNAASGPESFPDRAAIWAGALAGQGLEIAWLRDKPDHFIMQVQGSARLRWTDGGITRLRYSGRNGHPYTSIGRKLVERGIMTLPDMILARLMGWLRDNPAEARLLMEENRSFIFFERDDTLDPADGPIGGAGTPLVPGRSLAVDRNLWPYGLPVFIDVNPLVPAGGRMRITRLMVAQDTGSAILGPARGDFFVGSGDAAGERAGLFRDPMRFVVLVPRGD